MDSCLHARPRNGAATRATQTRAMSLPSPDDEAALRALDAKCAKPDSVISKRTVAQIAAASAPHKRWLLHNSAVMGLGHLVRCALEAKMSPDTLTGDVSSGHDTRPILCVATQPGALPALKALLAGGANVELADERGITALALAAGLGALPAVRLLLDAGANANTQDSLGTTPLMLAILGNRVECARALLPFSDLSIANRYGYTAFHVAVLNGNEACFELLLPVMDVDVRTQPGVDVNGMPFDKNSTALHIACETGQLTMCKALLQRGADRNARSRELRTPLHLAAHGGHVSCVLQLVGRPGRVRMTPAEVDAADVHGRTALHKAAWKGFDLVCDVLLRAGASLDTKTKYGFTPLMLAEYEFPTNAALIALLSGNVLPRPVGLTCDHCGKTADEASNGLKVCRDCLDVRYCCQQGQLAAWPGHKAACKARAKEREEAAKARTILL